LTKLTGCLNELSQSAEYRIDGHVNGTDMRRLPEKSLI
jgi:hypothetical protein